jgi:hypothetical protein
VKACEYFDKKNKERVQQIRTNLVDQREVIDLSANLLELVQKMMDKES